LKFLTIVSSDNDNLTFVFISNVEAERGKRSKTCDCESCPFIGKGVVRLNNFLGKNRFMLVFTGDSTNSIKNVIKDNNTKVGSCEVKRSSLFPFNIVDLRLRNIERFVPSDNFTSSRVINGIALLIVSWV
jgi:hypothetical protein